MKEPKLPISILSKLYDETGCSGGGMKGYYLFYINANGDPAIYHRAENEGTRIAIETTIREIMESQEEMRSFAKFIEDEDD